MKQVKLSAIGVLLSAVLVSIASIATAGMIELKDADGALWDVTWTSPQLGLAFEAVPNDALEGHIGTLIKTLTYRDLNPVDIKFTQKTMLNEDRFGLRFSLTEFVGNQSGKDWKGFKEELIDKDPNTPPAGGVHPGFAHFHRDGPLAGANRTIGADKFKLITVFQGTGVGRGVKALEFGDGLVSDGVNGGIWKPTFIGIHENTVGGKTREFTLRQTAIPVPEPGTMVLLGIGLGGLVLLGRYRQRRNT